MVIKAALAGEAPWVVTVLSLRTYETVTFMTARAFLERLDEEVPGPDADEAPDSGDEVQLK
jgi:hypothetical protein